jgi:hypothetical protein
VSTSKQSGGGQSAPSARDRALGASPLTQRIYQAVLAADRPLTTKEIWAAIKDIPGVGTDTRLWAQGKGWPMAGDTNLFGLRRVRQRTKELVQGGVLVADGAIGRGIEAHYTAGRPPKGFRSHKALRPWGWHDLDVEGQTADRDRLIARSIFLDRAHAALQKKKIDNARELLTEAVRLLEV